MPGAGSQGRAFLWGELAQRAASIKASPGAPETGNGSGSPWGGAASLENGGGRPLVDSGPAQRKPARAARDPPLPHTSSVPQLPPALDVDAYLAKEGPATSPVHARKAAGATDAALSAPPARPATARDGEGKEQRIRRPAAKQLHLAAWERGRPDDVTPEAAMAEAPSPPRRLARHREEAYQRKIEAWRRRDDEEVRNLDGSLDRLALQRDMAGRAEASRERVRALLGRPLAASNLAPPSRQSLRGAARSATEEEEGGDEVSEAPLRDQPLPNPTAGGRRLWRVWRMARADEQPSEEEAEAAKRAVDFPALLAQFDGLRPSGRGRTAAQQRKGARWLVWGAVLSSAAGMDPAQLRGLGVGNDTAGGGGIGQEGAFATLPPAARAMAQRAAAAARGERAWPQWLGALVSPAQGAPPVEIAGPRAWHAAWRLLLAMQRATALHTEPAPAPAPEASPPAGQGSAYAIPAHSPHASGYTPEKEREFVRAQRAAEIARLRRALYGEGDALLQRVTSDSGGSGGCGFGHEGRYGGLALDAGPRSSPERHQRRSALRPSPVSKRPRQVDGTPSTAAPTPARGAPEAAEAAGNRRGKARRGPSAVAVLARAARVLKGPRHCRATAVELCTMLANHTPCGPSEPVRAAAMEAANALRESAGAALRRGSEEGGGGEVQGDGGSGDGRSGVGGRPSTVDLRLLLCILQCLEHPEDAFPARATAWLELWNWADADTMAVGEVAACLSAAASSVHDALTLRALIAAHLTGKKGGVGEWEGGGEGSQRADAPRPALSRPPETHAVPPGPSRSVVAVREERGAETGDDGDVGHLLAAADAQARRLAQDAASLSLAPARRRRRGRAGEGRGGRRSGEGRGGGGGEGGHRIPVAEVAERVEKGGPDHGLGAWLARAVEARCFRSLPPTVRARRVEEEGHILRERVATALTEVARRKALRRIFVQGMRRRLLHWLGAWRRAAGGSHMERVAAAHFSQTRVRRSVWQWRLSVHEGRRMRRLRAVAAQMRRRRGRSVLAVVVAGWRVAVRLSRAREAWASARWDRRLLVFHFAAWDDARHHSVWLTRKKMGFAASFHARHCHARVFHGWAAYARGRRRRRVARRARREHRRLLRQAREAVAEREREDEEAARREEEEAAAAKAEREAKAVWWQAQRERAVKAAEAARRVRKQRAMRRVHKADAAARVVRQERQDRAVAVAVAVADADAAVWASLDSAEAAAEVEKRAAGILRESEDDAHARLYTEGHPCAEATWRLRWNEVQQCLFYKNHETGASVRKRDLTPALAREVATAEVTALRVQAARAEAARGVDADFRRACLARSACVVQAFWRCVVARRRLRAACEGRGEGVPAFLTRPLSALMTPLLLEDEEQVERYVLPDPVRDLARLRKRAAQRGGEAGRGDAEREARLVGGERLREQDLSGDDGAESGREGEGEGSEDSLEGPAKALYEELLMRSEVEEAGTLRDHSLEQEQEGEKPPPSAQCRLLLTPVRAPSLCSRALQASPGAVGADPVAAPGGGHRRPGPQHARRPSATHAACMTGDSVRERRLYG